MSDFLGRLLGAAHTPAVRPLLRSRFEPESRDLGVDTGAGFDADAPAVPAGPPASTPPDDAVPRLRAAPIPLPEAAPPAATRPPDAAEASHAMAPAVLLSPAERAPVAPVWPAPAEPAGSAERPRRGPTSPRAHPVTPLGAAGPSPARTEAARLDPPKATLFPRAPVMPPAKAADRADGGPRHAGPAAGPSAEPAPVRPPVPEAPRAVAPLRPPARRERTAEPTVHITIGRVEVRATAESAAPRRREVPRRPVLGLDDYLKNRAGGERP